MANFEKETEKTVRDDVIDAAYIDRLLSGDRKPVKPIQQKNIKPESHPAKQDQQKDMESDSQPNPTYPKYILWCGIAALLLVFAFLTITLAISVGRRTDPNFGFKDLFAPTTAAATQPTTTAPKVTLSTSPATKPTEPPTEPPLRLETINQGDITYMVPSEILDISLREYYCTSPSLPIPGSDATYEEWVQFFYSLLSGEDSWYAQALLSHFASPEQIDMELFLYRGVAQDASPAGSYPEATWLLAQGFQEDDQVFRMPVADINSLVGVYFGTTFEEHEMPQYKPQWKYNKETGCYYYADKIAVSSTFLGITSFSWQQDGTLCVGYAAGPTSDPRLNQMVLRPVGDYFQIVSNLPAPTEPSTVELEDIPDMSGHVYEPGAIFAGEGYYGTAKWDAGDFSISLPLLEPFCEGAKAINEEIKSIYQPIIDDVKQNILYQTSSRYWKVSYTTYVGDDVLSIVISEHTMSDSVFYQVFNLDLATGQQLDQYEMIRRYTGMSYPEFLLRANFTVANHLRKEYPMESEEVTNWLAKLETDVLVLDGHKLILNEEGTLILLNDKIHSMAAGYLNVQIPFDPEACGEEFTDWELESYRWLFDIPADGAYSYHKGDVLIKAFFFDPERFLRYLSGSEYWLSGVASLMAFELEPENAPLLRDLCKQYLGRSDTAKAAQAILDQMEKYADYY